MPDVTAKETAKEIDSASADWVARLDRGVLSPEDSQALDAWLAVDPRRAGAFARARAISLYSERARALGTTYDPAQFVSPALPPKQAVSRRQMLWGSGAMAASVAGVLSVGLTYSARGEEYATHRGQMKVVPLSDGSVISLNTSSRIRVVYTKKQRTVHLEKGEALFDVAKDEERPFLVLAGETEVFAVGTSFSVRHLADAPVEVLVREGIVEITPSARLQTKRLGANMRATVQPNSDRIETIAALAPIEAERAMAWREGRIVFEGQALKQAVLEFQRYSDTRIIIDDPAIANEPITGLFQVDDPVGFAKAVAVSFGLHAEVSEKQVRLRS